MTKLQKLIAASATLAAALALTGCVVIKGPVNTSQGPGVPPVHVSFTICASNHQTDGSNNPTHPGCEDYGNSNNDAPHPATGQVLIAFRVPTGTGTPDTFTTSNGPALTFRRSPSYQDQLQGSVPPPSGQQWVGYISDPYDYDTGPDGTPAQQTDVNVDFALPQQNGYPFQGPFRVRPVVGVRRVDDSNGLSASRPVSCGDDPYADSNFPPTTFCIDSPDPATAQTDILQPTRDLGLVGTVALGNTGRSGNVPFNAKYNGAADPASTFALSASTDLPGATATPNPGSVTPASDSDNPVNVAVAVPKNAKPGTYKVTLVAKAPNGQTRTGVSELRVRDKTKPVMRSLRLSPRAFAPLANPTSIAAVRHRTTVSYRVSEASTVRFGLQRCVKASKGTCRRYRNARGHFNRRSRAGANRFRFTGYFAGKRLKPGLYRLVGTPVDPSKNKGRAVRAAFRIR